MHRITALYWCSLALLLITSETRAGSCPQQIRGGWESAFPLGNLLEISLRVQAGDNDLFAAKLLSASGPEELAVRRDGRYLQLQSTRRPRLRSIHNSRYAIGVQVHRLDAGWTGDR